MKARLSLLVIMCVAAAGVQAGGVIQELPPVSLGSGQTLRLTVLDTAPASTESAKGKARKWTMAFDVYATDTRVDGGEERTSSRVRFLRRESMSVVLRAGEGASFDFVTADGKMIVPCVMGPPDAKEDSNVRVGLEVREGSRTMIVLPAVQRGFNPQPDPPGEK